MLIVYLFSFIVLYRVERFIYRCKKIYDDVSLLNQHIHKSAHYDWYGNIDQGKKKVATDKKLEIEMLQVREEYRREFLGNVSHELKTPLFTVQDIYPLCWTGQWMIKWFEYLKRADKEWSD
jgi:two-component system phosphate regulon sensor histidine kinase PhoR